MAVGEDGGFSWGADVGTAVSSALSMKSASDNRKWMHKMDNTKAQRRVKDLRAAGLNPILAAGSGGMSSSGPGTPPMPTVDFSARMLERSLQKSTKQKLDAETALTKEKTKVVQPVATGMEELNNAMKLLIKQLGGPGVIEKATERVSNAVDLSRKADEIRNSPGIELTDHAKAKKRETEYQKGFKNRRKNRGQRGK